MGAWIIVARREYAEGVRSKWFIAATVLGPLLFVAVIALVVGLQLWAAGKPVRIALVDESPSPVGTLVEEALREAPDGAEPRFIVERVHGADAEVAALQARITSESLDGYLVLPADVNTKGHVRYVGTDASSQIAMARLSFRVESAVVRARGQVLGLTPEQTTSLLASVEVDARQADGSNASGKAAFGIAYGAAAMLYIAIQLYGIAVMRAVIQEKTSRVLEVVVACASPWDLMAGKVIGVGAVGLTQMGCWMGLAVLALKLKDPLLAGIDPSGVEPIGLPPIDSAAIAILLVYFIAGYLLYAAMFAAVGAACSSERDAQQAQMPVAYLFLAGFLLMPVAAAAPRDGAAVATSLVPFFSPVLMPARYFLTPVPAWQLAASLALLLATIPATTWCAARIYRVGILMYGKRPSARELWRWIREQ